MDAPSAHVTELDSAPNLAALFAKAAVTSWGRGGGLPDTHLVRRGVAVDPAHLAAYDHVCRLPLNDTLPATYPHMLTFPLQMALMTERSFPFGLPGLVHARNRIDVLRAIRTDEELDLEVWAENLARHRSGAAVDLRATVTVAGEEVWRSTSTYLSRGAKAPEGAPEAEIEVSVGALDRVSATWRIPDDAGRRYAKVSGDVNPIHLSGLTAKAFGFKRAIAHGMWVKARVLGALSGRLPDAVNLDVSFRKPLFLPSTVTLSTAQAGGGWDFDVSNAASGTEHVVGTIRPL